MGDTDRELAHVQVDTNQDQTGCYSPVKCVKINQFQKYNFSLNSYNSLQLQIQGCTKSLQGCLFDSAPFA